MDNCGRITVASAGSYMWACHIISPKLMVTISQSDPTANQLETPNMFDLDPLFEKVGLIVKITCFYVSWEDLGGECRPSKMKAAAAPQLPQSLNHSAQCKQRKTL